MTTATTQAIPPWRGYHEALLWLKSFSSAQAATRDGQALLELAVLELTTGNPRKFDHHKHALQILISGPDFGPTWMVENGLQLIAAAVSNSGDDTNSFAAQELAPHLLNDPRLARSALTQYATGSWQTSPTFKDMELVMSRWGWEYLAIELQRTMDEAFPPAPQPSKLGRILGTGALQPTRTDDDSAWDKPRAVWAALMETIGVRTDEFTRGRPTARGLSTSRWAHRWPQLTSAVLLMDDYEHHISSPGLQWLATQWPSQSATGVPELIQLACQSLGPTAVAADLATFIAEVTAPARAIALPSAHQGLGTQPGAVPTP